MGGEVSKFFGSRDSVKKNEKQSSYVSLRDLLENCQTSVSVTSFITSTTLTTSQTKTIIGGCGSYTMVEMYDKLNPRDENVSLPSCVPPYLNYPHDFSFSDYDADENKGYLFNKICDKTISTEGPKEMNNNDTLSQVQGILDIEDNMVKREVKGKMSIEDLKVMLLDVMTILKTNGRLRVHIVLEQVDNENGEKDNKNSKGKGAKLVTKRV